MAVIGLDQSERHRHFDGMSKAVSGKNAEIGVQWLALGN